jgi:AcrR family transcriptional regulator
MKARVQASATRQHILSSALRHFANNGYAAASVQRIVGDARVSKPSLYYYFPDKAGLFQALVDEAHDDRYRLMQNAAARGRRLKDKLVEILAALFDHLRRNRELMRISFATAFAAPGEVPEGLRCSDKCERNFELIRAMFQKARSEGEGLPCGAVAGAREWIAAADGPADGGVVPGWRGESRARLKGTGSREEFQE